MDENVSPKTSMFLRSFGLDISDVREIGLQGESDDVIYEYAKENGLVLITFDHEFGYLYLSKGDLEGLMIIRVHPQNLEIVHPILKRFFDTIKIKNIDIRKKIFVIEKSRFRIRKV